MQKVNIVEVFYRPDTIIKRLEKNIKNENKLITETTAILTKTIWKHFFVFQI